MKLVMTARILLLNMTNASMCQSLGDVGKSDRVVESLSGVEERLEVIHVEIRLVKARPIGSEPVVELLNMKEVFSSKPDSIPHLFSVDQVRIIDESPMQSSEPEFNAENRVLVNLNDVAASFLELTAEHSLEVGGVVHQDLARDLH